MLLKDLFLKQNPFLEKYDLTLRELDVLAVFFTGKTAKVNSLFLGIEVKTFQTHLMNLKRKLKLFSKDHVIRFVEDHNYTTYCRYHYQLLALEKKIRSVTSAKIFEQKQIVVFYHHSMQKKNLEILKRHLSAFNVKASFSMSEDEEILCKIYLPQDNVFSFPLHAKQVDEEDFQEKHYIDLLVLILKNLDIEEIILEELKRKDLLLEEVTLHEQKIDSKKKLRFDFIIFVMFGLFFLLYIFFDFSKKHYVHYSFNLPVSSQLAKRNSLFYQLKRTLEKTPGDSHSVRHAVLTGLGGSGKTTLARLYAKQSSYDIIWEINAQTAETIVQSFFQMAYAMVKTVHEKSEIEFIEKINDKKIKIQRLLSFIKERLKKSYNWLLVFDDVTSIQDVQDFLPQDTNIWGKGSYIITTRDDNLKESGFFDDQHFITVTYLTDEDALKLFSQIYYKTSFAQLSVEKKQQIQYLLKNIPLYPLDIILAAHYLRQTKMPFDHYVEHTNMQKKTILESQESAKDSLFHYSLTRLSLIEDSFSHIIQMDQRFEKILFFLAFLNYKNIPKKLLIHLFDINLVADFIKVLKKHSLISEYDVVDNGVVKNMMSFNIKLQDCGNKFFLTKMTQKEWHTQISHFIEEINCFIKNLKRDEYYNYTDLIPHVENFIHYINFVFDDQKEAVTFYYGELFSLLGTLHFMGTRQLHDARYYFEKSLLSNSQKIDEKKLIHIYKYLSMVCTDLADAEAAIQYAEKALDHIAKNKSEDWRFEKSQMYFQLGYAYTLLGRVEKAKAQFNEALFLLDEIPQTKATLEFKSNIKSQQAWLYATMYLTQDKASHALQYIDDAIASIYEPQEKMNIIGGKKISRFVSYHYTTKGDILCKLGRFHEAYKEGFKEALYIVENGLDGCRHLILQIYIEIGLGECFLRTGRLEKAEKTLLKIIDKGKELLGENCLVLFPPGVFLMETYLRLSKLQDAENEMLKLFSYKMTDKTSYMRFIECLFYYNVAILHKEKNDFEKSFEYFQKFFSLCQDFFKQYFPLEEYKKIQETYILKNPVSDLNSPQNLALCIQHAKNLLNIVYPQINFYG